MNKNFIDYSALVDDAMHFIVKKSLEIFAKSDIHGDHHFFISFVTKYPGVIISEKLHNRYPYEMTIVLQYQFEDLKFNDESFNVFLSFDNQKENITIPFAALTAFADPSVKFGLQFRHVDENHLNNDDKNTHAVKTDNTNSQPQNNQQTTDTDSKDNVIRLDFRNKKIIK